MAQLVTFTKRASVIVETSGTWWLTSLCLVLMLATALDWLGRNVGVGRLPIFDSIRLYLMAWLVCVRCNLRPAFWVLQERPFGRPLPPHFTPGQRVQLTTGPDAGIPLTVLGFSSRTGRFTAVGTLPPWRGIADESRISPLVVHADPRHLRVLTPEEAATHAGTDGEQDLGRLLFHQGTGDPLYCPVCMEQPLHAHDWVDWRNPAPSRVTSHVSCCGQQICRACLASLDAHGHTLCPLCRQPRPQDPLEELENVLAHARDGKVWAQLQLGVAFLTQQRAKRDRVAAFNWIKLAAEAGDPKTARVRASRPGRFR